MKTIFYIALGSVITLNVAQLIAAPVTIANPNPLPADIIMVIAKKDEPADVTTNIHIPAGKTFEFGHDTPFVINKTQDVGPKHITLSGRKIKGWYTLYNGKTWWIENVSTKGLDDEYDPDIAKIIHRVGPDAMQPNDNFNFVIKTIDLDPTDAVGIQQLPGWSR